MSSSSSSSQSSSSSLPVDFTEQLNQIIAGNNTGISTIGITSGYGDEKTLSSTKPTFIVSSILEIANKVTKSD